MPDPPTSPPQSFSFSRMRVISIYSWDHRWTEATIILHVRTTAQSSLLASRLTTIPEGNRILWAHSLPFWPSPSLTWALRHSHKPPIVRKLLRSRLVVDWIGAGTGRLHWLWVNYHLPTITLQPLPLKPDFLQRARFPIPHQLVWISTYSFLYFGQFCNILLFAKCYAAPSVL